MPKESKSIRKNIRQHGWGLTETLLTIGALSIMSVAIYTVFKPTSATAQVRIEQDNLRDISRNVDRSFGMLGSFEGLTTDRVSDEGLAPSRMERAGGRLQTDWGTEATVQPYENPAKGITSNTAFSVVYPGTPGEVCSGLSSAMARDAFDILVNGESIYDTSGMSPSLASQRCADGDATMEFVFHSGLVAGETVATPSLVLPPAPPSVSRPPSTPPVMDIPDNPGVDDATPGVIPSPPAGPSTPPPAPPPVVPPPPVSTPDPVVVTNPPPPPVTPPGSMCNPEPTPLPNNNQTLECLPGESGEIRQTQTRTQHYTCPEAWDNPQPSHVAEGVWVTVSNTCACPDGEEIQGGECKPKGVECPLPEEEVRVRNNVNMCEGNMPTGGVSPEEVWGGNVTLFETWRRSAVECTTAGITWGPWARVSTSGGVSGGCFCEVIPYYGDPIAVVSPAPHGGWDIDRWGNGSVMHQQCHSEGPGPGPGNPTPPPLLPSCECTGNMYVGGGYVDSFGTFPNMAACEAARDGNSQRVCTPQMTLNPPPPGNTCVHMMPINWATSAPKTLHCKAM